MYNIKYAKTSKTETFLQDEPRYTSFHKVRIKYKWQETEIAFTANIYAYDPFLQKK